MLALVALVAAAGGIVLLAGAGHGLRRHHVTVGGVPMDEVHPAGLAPGQRRPGVVVAHGFAGSAELMAPFGDSLAGRGYVVVLLDFAGHGANIEPLPDDAACTEASTVALQHDLGVALAHLRTLPDVDPARIALVGHSMGATEVTRYAAAHPDVTTTVAISLPGSSVAQSARPARLLLLYGGLEFPGFRAAATDAAAHGGADRRATAVPGVEHISILYAPRTHRETVAWLDRGLGGPLTDRPIPSPLRRIGGAALLTLAFLLGIYPLAARLLPGGGRWPRFDWPVLGRAGLAAIAAGVPAVFLARILPTVRLPIAIGGFVLGYTAVAGILLTAAGSTRLTAASSRWLTAAGAVPATATATGPSTATATGPATATGTGPATAAGTGPATAAGTTRQPSSSPPAARGGRWRLAVVGLAVVGYAVLAIALPLNLGLTHAVPVGPRWWLLPLLWAGFAVLAYGAERIAGGNSLGVLLVSAVIVLGLGGAAAVGLTHGFVLLVAAPLALLFVWQALWSAVLNRFGAPAGLTALAGSVVVAWPIAIALPLLG